MFRLIPPPPDFASTTSEAERAVVAAHVAYWSELMARDQVVAFGPVGFHIEISPMLRLVTQSGADGAAGDVSHTEVG